MHTNASARTELFSTLGLHGSTLSPFFPLAWNTCEGLALGRVLGSIRPMRRVSVFLPQDLAEVKQEWHCGVFHQRGPEVKRVLQLDESSGAKAMAGEVALPWHRMG